MLQDEIGLFEGLTVLDDDILHEVAVEFLEVADEAGFPVLQAVEEAEVGLQLCVEEGDVHLRLQQLVCEVEEVVDAVIGFELQPFRRSSVFGY